MPKVEARGSAREQNVEARGSAREQDKEALVNKVGIGFSVSLFIACAPELRAGEGERCDRSNPCADTFSCYRGFCVPESTLFEPPIDDENDSAEVRDVSRNAGAQSPFLDAGAGERVQAVMPATEDVSAPHDGAIEAQTNGARSPPSRPVTATPATGSDAATSPSPVNAAPASSPRQKPGTTPVTPSADAGAKNLDAGVSTSPDAALPAKCTLDECCAEATAAEDVGGKGSGNAGKDGRKKCGCDEPGLLRTLTCGIVAPVLTPLAGLL